MVMPLDEMEEVKLSQKAQEHLLEVQGAWQLLKQVGMEDYAPQIIAEGFETAEDVKGMRQEDLADCGVSKRGHISRFLRNIQGQGLRASDHQPPPTEGRAITRTVCTWPGGGLVVAPVDAEGTMESLEARSGRCVVSELTLHVGFSATSA